MARSDRRVHHQITFAWLTLGVGAFALLQSLVVPVLTTVQRELHTSQSAVTWLLTAYLLSAAIATPILGRVGDIVGKERMYVVTLVALAAGSLLAAVATSISVMIIARVIQGIGGGVLPVAFGIIRDEFPRERVGAAVGSLAALTAVGGAFGIVLAGPIVDALDYHWLFWFPMILTIVAAIGAVLFIPESPIRSPSRVSWLPALLLSSWLVALLVALSEAPAWGWGSVRTLALLVAAVILGIGWYYSELRAPAPLVDIAMMRRRAVWTNNLATLLIGFSMYATIAFLPEFVQTPTTAGYGFGASVTRSGLIILPSAVMMFVVGLSGGALTRRFGGKTVVIFGCLIAAVSMAMYAFTHAHQLEVFVASGIQGVGLGLAFPAVSALAVAAVPAEQTGVASGMNANIRSIGGSIGAAVMASIVTSQLLPSGLPRAIGYTAGFSALAGGFVLAALAAVLIPASRGQTPTTDPRLVSGLLVVVPAVGEQPG